MEGTRMTRAPMLCALALACFATACGTAAAQSRVQAGVLECRGAGSTSFVVGSVHQLHCVFSSDRGPRYPYYGLVRRFGLDVGFTQGSSMVWAVFAPTRRIGPGDLSGSYGGVTAGAAIGIGGNANALIGGSGESLSLRTLSFGGPT